ncbi:NAD-dependent epimerase/dehydratase family protein [Actinomycetospora lemnae]|uniref:NAD(P)-dependent oxidoreductase n=1 Tax=Actinomycetospora lemnae TaxID=3019891 RepID=A0ABT5SWW9_9PSEU|nr:NAD(P)-dependent oxidoreductase [Actinomycetospora sp. DW7H6]MDD7967350.1 NAD(P)-dependent oxidoreductase [Actinomycetospora sp. DW7H6]
MSLPAPRPASRPALSIPAPTPQGDDDPIRELRGRRVLVTGATGFVGRHLCRRLLRLGAEVHALSRDPRPHVATLPDLTWHRGDLTDDEDVAAVVGRVRPAAVLHLASLVQGDRESALALPMLEANTHAAVAVMTAAHDVPGCRVVLAGSVEEPRGDEPPVSPYAAAKSAATGYARLFHAQWGLPVTVLRLAMVYGPDQPDTRKLVPYVCSCLLEGTTPALSSGTRMIDWVYVDDVCDAFVRAATTPGAAGLVLDVGSGRTSSIAEVVRTLADLAGHHGPLGFGETEDRRHDLAHVVDPGPAAAALGWRATTALRAGLARTLAWHEEQRTRPVA